MAIYRLSVEAESDLLAIGSYGNAMWGEIQAISYVDELERCCLTLVDMPGLGRKCDHIRPGLHRLEHESHVILYRQKPYGILIVRILHKRMLPENHTFEDSE